MQRGSIKSVRLSERVTSGRDQWLQWHTEFARNFPKYVQASRLPRSQLLNDKTLQNLLPPVNWVCPKDWRHWSRCWHEVLREVTGLRAL